MRRKIFDIHLESEVAVGTPGSVSGGRDTLDYLPGSLFLGAAASKLYASLGDMAWPVFHGGKVRFGDGLPLARSGLIALPMPKCLAAPKHAAGNDHRFGENELVNPAFTGRHAGLDKPNVPYLSLAGEKVRPLIHYRLKTAVDPRSGTSMARQLYGYHGLAAGQVYRCTLESDDDLPAEVFDRLVGALSGAVRLGRSRSAEYGRCRIFAQNDHWAPAVARDSSFLTVYLLSHLVVEDDAGASVALPESTQLGLPPGELVDARCFVRHQRQAVYNGTYRAFEADFFAVERGSVLCYRMDAKDIEAALALPLRYAGLQQQRGFGRLLLNPAFLMDEHPRFTAVPVDESDKDRESEKNKDAPIHPNKNKDAPIHPLAKWLVDQVTARDHAGLVRRTAETWYGELADLYRSARVRAGLPQGTPVGPTPSQWGRVAAAAQRETVGTTDMARLEQALFDPVSGICKPKDPDWSAVILHDDLEAAVGQAPCFRNWLAAKLDWCASVISGEQDKPADRQRAEVLAHFARFAADRAKQQRDQEVLG